MGLFHSKFKGNLYYPGTTEEEHKNILFFLNKLSKIPIFAHHPTCQYHSNHLINIGSKSFCLGCFFMYSGIVAGTFLIYFLDGSTFPPWKIFLLGFCIFPPTIIQIFYQKYLFKVFSRFLLGIAISLFTTSIVFALIYSHDVLVASLLAFTFLCLFNFTVKLRKRNIDIPCTYCKKGGFPICEYKLPDIKRVTLENNMQEDKLPPAFIGILRSVIKSIDVKES
jgi:hypothetical protein